MNSKEIVRRTLDYDRPERVARSFGDADFCDTGPAVETPATPWRRVDDNRWERTDEWGNLWQRVDPTSKGEVARGVLESLDHLDRYEFPDYSRAEDYEPVRQARKEHPDQWLTGGLPGFAFNIARKLRRLDHYLADLLLQPERIHALHDHIDAVLEEMIRRYADAGVDAILTCEDWGSQTRLLISPDVWRKEFFPRFEKLCGLAHDLGLRVFLHSCGQIESIVPGLIEAGVDALQLDQPELHGLDALAAHQERGRITFWCPVDIQTTLQTGDEGLIRSRAREMLDKLWRGRGGFIAGYYGDTASIGIDPAWQDWACDEFARHGRRHE